MKLTINHAPNDTHVDVIMPKKDYQTISLISNAMSTDKEFCKCNILSVAAYLACMPETSAKEILAEMEDKSKGYRSQLKMLKL
jgi:hypothetical protein